MTLEEYKDVSQLHNLASEWIEDYEKNNLGKHSAKLKKQYKEMQQLFDKTKQLIDKSSDGAGSDLSDDELLKEITRLGKGSPAFASCFGNTDIPFDDNAPVSKETTTLAFNLKKLTSTWYGKFSDSSQDNTAVSLVASIHEQAKKIIKGPKTLDENQMSIFLYYSKSRDCGKMLKNAEFVNEEYDGALGLTCHLSKDGEKLDSKLGIENFPAVVFKRGSHTVAKHEGYLSLSALQQKVGVLMTGANFSDSSSVKSVKDLKSVNKKELYNMGEHLLFYFIIHDCGVCKKTTPIIKKHSMDHHNVKFEQIKVDKSHRLHTSFGINKVPALVFVHDGKIVGKHTGYINSADLERRLEAFAISNKKNLGNTTSDDFTVINKYLKDLEKGKKIKEKNANNKEKKV